MFHQNDLNLVQMYNFAMVNFLWAPILQIHILKN